MPETPMLDKVIKNVQVVRPHCPNVERLDLGIKDGKFAQIAPNISPDQAKEVFDAQHLLGFPGLVDAHMHIGIYQSLDKDAITESKAAAMGGVTTSLNYMRTGQYYLNKGGSYQAFFPRCWLSQQATFLSITAFTSRLSALNTLIKCSGCTNRACLLLKSLCFTVGMASTISPINRICS